MNITVYLGSNDGSQPIYRQEAKKLGEWLGKSGHTLIYGGSRVGLMGVLAEAALKNGGRVIGVEPRFFVENEIQHHGLTKLIITETMAERKQKMIAMGEAFLAFPGGIGTLEEMSEVMSLVKLKRLNKPFCFLNFSGYYEPLRQFFQHMAREGFVDSGWANGICFAESIEEMARHIMPSNIMMA